MSERTWLRSRKNVCHTWNPSQQVERWQKRTVICIYRYIYVHPTRTVSVTCFVTASFLLVCFDSFACFFWFGLHSDTKIILSWDFSPLKAAVFGNRFLFLSRCFLDRNGIWNIRNYLNSTIVSEFLFLGDNAHSKMSPLGHKNVHAVYVFLPLRIAFGLTWSVTNCASETERERAWKVMDSV